MPFVLLCAFIFSLSSLFVELLLVLCSIWFLPFVLSHAFHTLYAHLRTMQTPTKEQNIQIEMHKCAHTHAAPTTRWKILLANVRTFCLLFWLHACIDFCCFYLFILVLLLLLLLQLQLLTTYTFIIILVQFPLKRATGMWATGKSEFSLFVLLVQNCFAANIHKKILIVEHVTHAINITYSMGSLYIDVARSTQANKANQKQQKTKQNPAKRRQLHAQVTVVALLFSLRFSLFSLVKRKRAFIGSD